MKFAVRLFIQKHDSRSYTVTIPNFPGIAAYGPTLEECKQEIAEALERSLAELEPEALHRYALRPNQRLEPIAVELRPTDRHGKRRRSPVTIQLSLLVTPEEDGQILVSAPALRAPPLSFYVNQEEELRSVAQLELAQYFYGESFEEAIAHHKARHESLDVLEVSFTPRRAAERQDDAEQERFWALKASGVSLTAQVAEGQLRRAYRREREVEAVLSALSSAQRPSVLLVGPSGAGKSAIAHEVARRIARNECPESLQGRQVWSVTAEALLAGCQFIGQWEEKLNDLVREARKRRHILVIPDVAALADAGRHLKSDTNMADFLKPFVQSGDLLLIGESTPERLRRAEQQTPGFIAQLRSIPVNPTGEADTLSLLGALAREIERAEELRVEPSALEATVELTNRYMPYRAQPGKAVSLLEQIAGELARAKSGASRATLTRREITAGFTRQTGLPEFILADSIPLDLGATQAHFSDRIVGQPAAVAAMVDLIAMVKAGLNDPAKPLGVYLFIGPTGVGKTQLAKALAGYLFGDEKRMLRFDMSEYSDPAALRRLIGVPGLGREGGEGELTRAVRAQPFCVLLLDEFEKADPQIFDIFLQVLGEGRLTDATGATVSFQNAIIIMTSNLGASAREQRGMGLSTRSAESKVLSAESPPDALQDQHPVPGTQHSALSTQYWIRRVEQHFRPEFVNRIDQIVPFQTLDEAAMRKIASREIGEVLLREGLVRRNVLVEVEEPVIDLLLEQGFTATYGARPLKRAIERLLVLPLARYLAGRARPGADLLRLRRAGDQVELSAASLGGGEQVGGAAAPVVGGLEAGQLTRKKLDDRNLAEGFAELRRKLSDWDERDAVVTMRDERATSLAATNTPTFWDDGDKARATLARFYVLDRLLKRLQQLSDRAEYLEELAGLVHRQRDPRYRAELAESYAGLHRDVAFLEVELLCAHLEGNHRAVLRIRRVGAPTKEEGEPWAAQLAAIYLRWAARKGYELSLFALEPLGEAERRGGGLLAQHYPYAWRAVEGASGDELVKQLAQLGEPAELAIGLIGTNVYGFLKGEMGIHRRSDKKPSGERAQRLAEVQVTAIGEDEPDLWLERLLLARAADERERSAMSKKQLAALPQPPEPEVVRVYQIEGERLVRDLRTAVKTTDIAGVLGGALDDFILAYLRDADQKPA